MKLTCNEALEKLWELDEGTLAPPVEQALREHIAACPSCAAEYRATQKMLSSVTSVFSENMNDVSESFTDDVWRKIDRKKRERVVFYRIMPVAAAIFLAVAVNMFGYFSRVDTVPETVSNAGSADDDYSIYVAQNYLDGYDATYLMDTEVSTEQDVMLDELATSPSIVLSSEDIYNLMDDEQIDNMLAQYER